ncbi:TetR/AcrR family transcriptional regulator [Amycolatopsis aidingensis]|uniref:TetR/AcrR family transcriptional regulator n=1 Tax=Amycolatopsis aidingensis TaxID=2842453 RepID=UPI001C0E89F0|nr:TetR/AcrR family transcriptional regulator [Amycolatopsis aidingensis]
MTTAADRAAERAEQRRAEIVHAAFKVFTERGYHQAGIADIANELGIGHGTFYRYFANKRDILMHVLANAAERLMSVMAFADPQATNTVAEYRQQVEQICDRLFTLFVEDPEVVRLMFVEALGADPEMTALTLDTYRGLAKGTELYLRNGVEKGFLRADLDTEVTAEALIGVIISCGLSLLTAKDPAAQRDRWIQAGTRVMFEGIRSPE